jgi:hypothetical protein
MERRLPFVNIAPLWSSCGRILRGTQPEIFLFRIKREIKSQRRRKTKNKGQNFDMKSLKKSE